MNKDPLKVLKSYGFLTVWENSKDYVFSYGGNMGNSINSVKECLKGLFPEFDPNFILKSCYVKMGEPDYYWEARIRKTKMIK